MKNARQIVHDAKDLLTVCLAKAIDMALTEQLGDDWFGKFLQEDAGDNNRITNDGQTSVHDLDLQALLKLLRFKSSLSEQVLTWHGFYDGMDQYSRVSQERQFNNLLYRLINDFRNRIEAHTRAADIEKELSGQQLNRIYGYEEAYHDMCKLSQIFKKAKDSNNVPYCKRIAALGKQKKKIWVPVVATCVIVAAIAAVALLWFNGVFNTNVYTHDETPSYGPGEVTLQPIEVYYDDDEIVAVCYVMNGTDDTVTDVDVYDFKLTCNGKVLAEADFGQLRGAEIKSKDYIKWQFRFPKDTVFEKDANLKELEWTILCNYE